jgi:hypothetical protein
MVDLWGWITSPIEANWETKYLKTKEKTLAKHHTTHKNGLVQKEVRQANQLSVCLLKDEWWTTLTKRSGGWKKGPNKA